MTNQEISQDDMFNAIFNKLHLHPIEDKANFVRAMTVLRMLGVKQNNAEILEEYNKSKRIAKAFADLKNNALHTGESKSRKAETHINIDGERDGDHGGV